MFNAAARWGSAAYEKAVYLNELTDAAIDVIVTNQAKKMSPLSIVPILCAGVRTAGPTAMPRRSGAAGISAMS